MRRPCAALGALVALLAPRPGAALEVDARLEQRLFARSVPEAVLLSQLRYPGLTTVERAERLAYQLRAAGHVEGRPSDSWGLRVGLDSGLLELADDGAFLDGRDPGRQISKTLLLGPTWAEWQSPGSGAVLVRAGKSRPRIGDGAIFDAYAFGLLVDLDLGLAAPEHPWRARAQVLFPSGNLEADTFESPLFEASVGYRARRHLEVGAFVAAYLDRGAVGPVLSDALLRGQAAALDDAFSAIADVLEANPCPPGGATNPRNGLSCLRDGLLVAANEGRIGFSSQTRGYLGWAGATGRVGGARWSVEGLAVFGFGKIDLGFEPDRDLSGAFSEGLARLPRRGGELAERVEGRLSGTRAVTVSSWLAQLTGRWSPLERLTVDGFALILSGDDGLAVADAADTRYAGFVSLAPLLAHTSIFFNGGLATAVASPTASALAPDAAGLAAGGLGATVDLGDRVRLRGVVAAMAALEPSPDGDRFEGVELNLLADAIVLDELRLFVDAAVFVPGPYFGDVPAGYQVIVGAQAVLPRD